MTYRWSLEGAAFEFPSPYLTENRFLVLRGCALLALALAVMLVLAFVGESEGSRPVVSLDKLPEKASVLPHLIGALLMALLGVLNLMQASRQRSLLLPPGQPMSLMPEVSHEATGSSTGAAWLMQAMERGVAKAPDLAGPYLGWLRLMGEDLAAAPTPLHGFVRVRVARLALQLGLALLLALGGVAALLGAKPAAWPLVALVVLLLGVAALARHLFYPAHAAPGPLAIAGLLAVGVAAALPLAWFSDVLPGASQWPRLGLPQAAAAMLALGLAFEALGMLAARAQLVRPHGARVEGVATTVGFSADPSRLIGEVDRELHRTWSEGVPNRRYARIPLQADAAAEEGSLNATVLEESQPSSGAAARGVDAPPAAAAPPPRHWLLALEVLGLCASVAGGLLWWWLAYAHMRDSGASWQPAALGLVGLLAGGYALRIGHMPWSRVEVQSRFIWLDFAGTYFRLPGAAPAEAPGRAPPAPIIGVEGLTVTARVGRARSVFYAAAPVGFGSRALLTLADDPAAARKWISLVDDFASNAARHAPADALAARAARALARERQGAAPAAAGAPRRPARFCSACGTPLLVGGRFCQQCGNPVAVE